ncbi:hypothetical protein D3C72_1402140 [compost metagenome]
MLAQAFGVAIGGGEVPLECAGAMAMGDARGLHGGNDRGHVAMTAELGDKAAARAQGTTHAFQHAVRVGHPMQRRVAEHCIERAVEGQRVTVHHLRIDTPCTGGDHHFRRSIDALHVCAAEGQFGGEHAIATAQVEDALAGTRVEQTRYGAAEGRHEAGIDRIVLGIPLLASAAGGGCGVEGAHLGFLRRWRWQVLQC